MYNMGAQWLSGRVLDSKPTAHGFDPHWRHCVVSLSKTNLSLLSTGSTRWLSGGVLNSRPKGRGFKPHRRNYVVSLTLSKTH